MIKEKIKLSKKILEEYPHTRGDGNGHFLNVVAEILFNDSKIDFNILKPEAWTRAKRKVLERNPHLDDRTIKTKIAERIVRSEVA